MNKDSIALSLNMGNLYSLKDSIKAEIKFTTYYRSAILITQIPLIADHNTGDADIKFELQEIENSCFKTIDPDFNLVYPKNYTKKVLYTNESTTHLVLINDLFGYKKGIFRLRFKYVYYKQNKELEGVSKWFYFQVI